MIRKDVELIGFNIIICTIPEFEKIQVSFLWGECMDMLIETIIFIPSFDK